MDRYLLKVGLLVQVDTEGEYEEDIAANFYARLSELVQSEDHMLSAEVEVFPLAGNTSISPTVAV
jgi:hypothetical protein